MQKFLEHLANDVEETKVRFRERWQKHANRRSTIALIVVAVIGGFLYYDVILPPNEFPLGELVTVPQGMTLGTIAETLQQDHVVQSARALRLAILIYGSEREVHAGDYLFKEPKTLFEVARALVHGQFGLEPLKIRVPEGATVAKMAKLFAPQLQRFDKDRFVKEATPLEGYLFPDTYFFLPNATDETVIETMKNNFDTHIADIQTDIASSSRSFSGIMIMASLVEREAFNTKDRRMIAGVLWNRLDRGMLLQVDAAFAYTLGKGSFELTKNDLASKDPYNTYIHKGLPPTPIGSPSMDSILAALHPIKSDYLFYLADRNHVTHYSKTYAQHLRYKEMYLGN